MSAQVAPQYVRDALSGLTPAQKRVIIAGGFSGDFTMATVRALKRKAIFFHKIDSPNGRCGPMVLTPLGETVREILKLRALSTLGQGEGHE